MDISPFLRAPNAESAVGRGADIAFKGCTQSFDGLTACGANDTVFENSHVGDKGGAVVIESGETSRIVMNGCVVHNCSAGYPLEEDPQGDGGGFSVATGTTLILESCHLTNNHCGKKVGLVFNCIRHFCAWFKMHLAADNFDFNEVFDIPRYCALIRFATILVRFSFRRFPW